MRKTKVQIALAAAAGLMLLGGCGTPPYELTKEEESIVVNYSAHVLAKYNKYQKDGLTYVYMEEPEEPEESEAPEISAAEPEEETEHAMPEESGQSGTAGENESEDALRAATFQDVFGREGLEITYAGAEISDSYVESDYYALNADAGKTYLIVKVNVSNTSDAAEELNMIAGMPKFRAVVNGEAASPSEVTILEEDFSTFDGTIEPGETVETVILFQIPASVNEISTLTVDALTGENDYQIILEK